MVSERAARARPPRANDPTATRDSEASARSEDVHVRSYAHQMGYDLEIELVDSDGSVAFRDRYYLQPGETEGEVDAVPDGEYEVRAVLDGDRETDRRCRIGSDPEETVVVEVGNGILSLTEGLRA
ncbi:hypothetical protein [Halobellus rarus]|uniref:Ig-like domain-containing protein n=1 Tax=Halobellus rarus TaxID=1126237 RepID=A0ABD6CKN9_9EURY|nr:hypothetical protein [Halobellus rarus]